MLEETNTVQTNDAVLSESGLGGEPTGSTETGESENQSSAKREPGQEGLFDGMDAQTLHKSYKSLQGEYTKVNESFKELEKYGGAKQLREWADYLSNNPRFADWVKQEQAKNVLGVDESTMSDEQREAMKLVRNMASLEAQEQVSKVVKDQIQPLAEAYKQQILDTHFKTMDSKYGNDWHEMRDIMSELSKELPESKQNKPEFDDIEDLFFRAVRKAGKYESYAAKVYEKKLTEKKSKSSDRPKTSSGESNLKPKSIQEAYEIAKRMSNT
jgi:hypothetical protein